ncbi:hypothetical protein ACTXT7_014272 [Hymenolepis weldensis]
MVFEEKPKTPPSRAQFKRVLQREEVTPSSAEIGSNSTSGVNTGVYYEIGTLLNAMVMRFFPTSLRGILLLECDQLVRLYGKPLQSTHLSHLLYHDSSGSGFLPLGFEYAAEITYPIEEGLTSGVLNTSAQIFGIALTYSATALLYHFGPLITNIFSLVCLLVAAVPTCFVKADLKRKLAQQLVSSGDE